MYTGQGHGPRGAWMRGVLAVLMVGVLAAVPRAHATVEHIPLLTLTCDGMLSVLSETPAQVVFGSHGGSKLADVVFQGVYGWVEAMAHENGCPPVSEAEFRVRWRFSVQQLVFFLVNPDRRLTKPSGWVCPLPHLVNYWSHLKYAVEMPATCNYARTLNGEPCLFRVDHPFGEDVDVSLLVTVDSCASPFPGDFPYVAVDCEGAACVGLIRATAEREGATCDADGLQWMRPMDALDVSLLPEWLTNTWAPTIHAFLESFGDKRYCLPDTAEWNRRYWSWYRAIVGVTKMGGDGYPLTKLRLPGMAAWDGLRRDGTVSTSVMEKVRVNAGEIAAQLGACAEWTEQPCDAPDSTGWVRGLLVTLVVLQALWIATLAARLAAARAVIRTKRE